MHNCVTAAGSLAANPPILIQAPGIGAEKYGCVYAKLEFYASQPRATLASTVRLIKTTTSPPGNSPT